MINHDESTYIVIADELLRGEVYLRDVIDTKPIGIFWLYAGLIKITGGSIPLLRLAATVVVALGAWGLYFGARRALLDERAGVAAGLAYCFISSIYTYYGLSPNTEIFFNGFTIAAVALAVAPRVTGRGSESFWHWPVAGLLLGVAMVIKPFAAAEALAVGLFLVWFHARSRDFGRMFLGGTALVAAFAVPLVLVLLYFRGLGMLDTLRFYLVDVNAAYPVELAWHLRLKYMGDYLLRYAPFVVLGALALVRAKENGSKNLGVWGRFLVVQFLLVTTVVLLTGKRFGHYQVQLHPPLAALAGCWWALGRPVFGRFAGGWLKEYTPALLLAVAGLIGGLHYVRFAGKDDQPPRVAAYLAEHLGEGETYFGLNGWQIAYHFLDRDVPTPYVHSSLLFLDHHMRAFQIDEGREAERLLSNERLTYLVARRQDDGADTPLRAQLLAAFTLVDSLPPDIMIYRRAGPVVPVIQK